MVTYGTNTLNSKYRDGETNKYQCNFTEKCHNFFGSGNQTIIVSVLANPNQTPQNNCGENLVSVGYKVSGCHLHCERQWLAAIIPHWLSIVYRFERERSKFYIRVMCQKKFKLKKSIQVKTIACMPPWDDTGNEMWHSYLSRNQISNHLYCCYFPHSASLVLRSCCQICWVQTVSKIQTQQISNITSWTTLLLTPQPETGQYHTQRAQNHLLEVEGKPYISLPLLSDFAYSLKLCKMLPNVNSKKGHLMSRSWIDLKAFGSSKMSTKLGHWKTRTCPSYTSTCFLLPSISDDSPICWQNIKKTSSLHSLSKKQETWLLHVGELHKLEQLPQNIWILRMLATMSKHRFISILTLG